MVLKEICDCIMLPYRTLFGCCDLCVQSGKCCCTCCEKTTNCCGTACDETAKCCGACWTGAANCSCTCCEQTAKCCCTAEIWQQVFSACCCCCSSNDDSDTSALQMAISFPPLGVFSRFQLKVEFWICLALTLLGYLPGMLYAAYVLGPGYKSCC